MKPEPIRREPTADARKAAVMLHDHYLALVQEGFTESQALQIIATLITANSRPPDPQP